MIESNSIEILRLPIHRSAAGVYSHLNRKLRMFSISISAAVSSLSRTFLEA